MTRIYRVIVVLFAFVFAAGAKPRLNFVCDEQNDLYQAVKQGGTRVARFTTAAEAIAKAESGSALLILADGYPRTATKFENTDQQAARAKKLKLYVEYPLAETFPGLEMGTPKKTEWERVVVASDRFGTNLARLRILAAHDCHFIPAKGVNPWLIVGRVAGFDTAVYGIPANAFPILFKTPDGETIIATTKLSNFKSGRYAPARDWETVLTELLAELSPENAPIHLKWEPSVRPAYSATAKLPRNAERKAFEAAADWVINSRLLVSPSETNDIYKALRANGESRSLPSQSANDADGSEGILEGYASGILHDGNQLQRLPLRADCHTESAMVLALDQDKRSRQISANLLDFVYFKSGMCAGPRANPKHGAFGLVAWGDVAPTWMVANYGDDDARVILATILSASSLKSDKWDAPITKAILANYRTTGKLGFRGDRIDIPALEQGWKQYYEGQPINYSPHFESYLWACNLWAYRQTGFRPFLDRTKTAISMTMKVYPTGWRWGDNSERARMLLCLSWLTQLENTPEHREWLMTVATDLLKRQGPSGAIHEWLGGTGGGHYQIPQSNEAYGTGETPLIQKNGDPASDQLYTTGFALLSLHEAVAATGDPKLKAAEDKLAQFLCRVQIRSKDVPYLNGWWFRAFDDNRWDYWSSSADVGWGAWSLESGWAQAWTAAVLAMRDKNTSFWEMTSNVAIKDDFNEWKPKMLE